MSNINFGTNRSTNNRLIENMADAKPLDYFNLSGNLKLAGSIRATDFIREDGTALDTVSKLALPKNFYLLDNKIGINQQTPVADFDVKGQSRFVGDLNVDGPMGVSGNFVGQSAIFGGSLLSKGLLRAEDELTVGKAATFGGSVYAKGLLSTEDGLAVGKNSVFGGSVYAKGLLRTDDMLSVGKAATFGSTVSAKGLLSTEDGLAVGKAATFGSSVYAKGLLSTEDGLAVGKNSVFGGSLLSKGLLRSDDMLSVGKAATFGSTVSAKGLLSTEDGLAVGKAATFGSTLFSKGLLSTEDGLAVGKNSVFSGTLLSKGHLRAEDELTVGKAANFGTSVYAKGLLRTDDMLSVGKAATFGSTVLAKGLMQVEDELTVGKTANFGGRVNLSNALLLNAKDIPHPDVGDGAFYRADGQVQIAADDVIRLRHVGSKATGIQFDVSTGPGDMKNPNGQMKITRQGIMFGGPNTEREANSAQISAGLHAPNSLNIVGMTSDTNFNTRRVDMFSEGGFRVNGTQRINGPRFDEVNVLNQQAQTTGQNVNSKVGGWIASDFGEAADKDRVVIGNLTNRATVGAHSAKLNAWKPLYLNIEGDQPVVVGPAGICVGGTCIKEDKLKELMGIKEYVNTTSAATVAKAVADAAAKAATDAAAKISADTASKVAAATVALATKKNINMYFPEPEQDAIIYQDVIDALLLRGVIVKYGNPAGWDDTTFRQNNLWNGRTLLRIGGKNPFPNGLLVKVPANKNVVWLRALSDRWQSFEVYNTKGESLGNYTTGYRNTNKLDPSGLAEAPGAAHAWFPINVPGPGNYTICAGNKSNGAGDDGWISGVAYTTNPWNHAMNSAVAYHWAINGGISNPWITENFNSDQLAKLDENQEYTLMVPVVTSGKDKLLYIVEIADLNAIEKRNDYAATRVSITVNDKPIEKFVDTYKNNPFATHHNKNNKFFAAKIPNSVVGNSRFLTVKINTKSQSGRIYFREIGTIDAQ